MLYNTNSTVKELFKRKEKTKLQLFMAYVLDHEGPKTVEEHHIGI